VANLHVPKEFVSRNKVVHRRLVSSSTKLNDEVVASDRIDEFASLSWHGNGTEGAINASSSSARIAQE